MTCPEQIILDPSELNPDGDRSELDLTPWIGQEGIDWGDATIAAYVAEEGRVGSYPVDHKLPNREITGPLVFVDRGTVTGSAGRALVQKKLALFQREGGSLKRVDSIGGTVFADVVDATFHATSVPGWASQQDIDVDSSFSLTCIPDFYGAEVDLGEQQSNSTNTWTETGILGDFPGRLRMAVEEDQSAGRRGFVYGFRDYVPNDPLVYEAEGWGLVGGATTTADGNASGGTVVTATLGSTWGSYLGGAIIKDGDFRLWGRVRSSSTSGAEVFTRWTYCLNGDDWISNDETQVTISNVFQWVDLGPVHIPVNPGADMGQQWYGYLQARGGAGGENCQWDTFHFVPTQHYYGYVKPTSEGSTYIVNSAGRSQLRTEGFWKDKGGNYWGEYPVWGDLPRMPVPAANGGTIEISTRLQIGYPGVNGNGGGTIGDSIPANYTTQLFYRPSYLFVP